MKRLPIIFILTLLTFPLFAQIQISGKITDEKTGEPLSGTNISIGGKINTISSSDGSFVMKQLKEGKYKVIFSYIGYQTIEREITLNENIELNIALQEEVAILNNVVVYALKNFPITQSEVSRESLESRNLGQDLPALLTYETSLVHTSDAGAGVGYTGLRIRGSDAQRINVTINGIPLNDSESQGVFWVNMPDFTSSVDNITIQRGVGTSVNGAGAFGASVNINTEESTDEAFVELNSSVGSFNTLRNNARFGTGLLKDKFSFSGRLSRISSDGFVDRSEANLRSFYVSGKYQGEKSNLTFNVFSGQEVTQQAWWGIPEAKLNNNAEGIESYIANNGLNEEQAANIRNSAPRTYNFYIYDNETDNYQQDHYQLLFNTELTSQLKLNSALHYTRGRGYFEQAIYNGALTSFGLDDVNLGGETISSSDLIVQRWLDNHFFGGIYSLSYQSKSKLGGSPIFDLILGGGWNRYEGDHFGEVIWSRFASNGEINHRYYDGTGLKTDFNTYLKGNYQVSNGLFLFADLQVRNVNYEIGGKDNNLRDISNTDDFTFFNPKVGLSYNLGNNELYATFAIANKEPNRNDYTDAVAGNVPEHETLRNLEVGYSKTLTNARFAINYYLMDYKNQLIPTGEVNDVGAAVRTNIDQSYRTGIELEGQVNLSEQFTLLANATFSQNKNRDFTELVINFDDFTFLTEDLGDTDIAFSPSIIAGGQLIYKPFKGFEMALMSKYVGEQFLDNTANDDRKIDAYFVNDFRVNYNFSTGLFKNIGLNLLVNNIFNTEYETNGYTYAYSFGGFTVREDHFFPQASTNFLFGLNIKI